MWARWIIREGFYRYVLKYKVSWDIFDVSCFIYKRCIVTTVLNPKSSLLRLLFEFYMKEKELTKGFIQKELYVKKGRELHKVYAVHLAVMMFV